MSYKNESYMLYFEIIRLIDKVQLCDLENYIYYKLADIDRYMKMKIKCNQIS